MLRACVALLMFLAATIPVDAESPARTALVVIDVQQFYFEGGSVPLAGPDEAARRAVRVLAKFREAGLPVIHVQHLPDGVQHPDPTGVEPQYRIHPTVLPLPGEPVVGKHHANAFRETDLLATLRELGARRLVIAGMQTHMCVEAAARAAADLGFDVVVVGDACATRALEFDGVEVPAEKVHAATLASLDGGYARVLTTDELLAELREADPPR